MTMVNNLKLNFLPISNCSCVQDWAGCTEGLHHEAAATVTGDVQGRDSEQDCANDMCELNTVTISSTA